MSLLVVDGLSRSFGGVKAAQGVSFTIAGGELVALIGPNGAGKSTIFNMVGGQLKPDAGRILLAGEDVTFLPPRARWRKGVGRTFQIAQTFVSMSVVENVQMALLSRNGESRALGRPAARRYREAALELLRRTGMAAQADRPCSVLAYGDVKRLELALALASEPKLLLMDEPTAGMSPKERGELMTLIAGVARGRGIAILFTEHDMSAVFGHADRILVLVRGEIIAAGTPDQVHHDARVQEIYLGRSGARAARLAGDAR